MGNHKFKLSDMIPNAWFYKLRDMNTTKLRSQKHSYYSHQPSFNIHNNNRSLLPSPSSSTLKPQPRNSSPDIRIDDKLICHASSNNLKLLDSRFPYTSQRKSTKKRIKRKTVYVPSPRKYAGAEDPYLSPQNEFYESPSSEFEEYSDSFDRRQNELIESSFYSTCNCKICSDIIIDVEEKTNSHHQNFSIKRVEEYDLVSELELPPILTKPMKQKSTENSSTSFKNSPVKNPKSYETQLLEKKRATMKITRSSTAARKPLSRSGKVRIRGKFSGKRSDVVHSRKSNARVENKGMLFYSDSFAIVKASVDPEKDFRDSMLEMIVDYNIRASKDLEELLACYLSLNSNQYHDLIIRSFMQIWFNFPYCSKKLQ